MESRDQPDPQDRTGLNEKIHVGGYMYLHYHNVLKKYR